MTASLAERLGYDAADRLLIVNCDDLGSSHAANVAIRKSMDEGIATSATLMVPCPWAKEAAEMFAGRDIGVHLTLTAEYPGYRWRPLTAGKSLRDADGCMPDNTEAVFKNADLGEARAECKAQIDQAIAWGVDITHLDSHMGANQYDARFFDIYLDLADEYDLPLRMVGRRADEKMGFGCRAKAAARRVLHTDNLLAPTWRSDTPTYLAERIPSLAAGVSEVFAHPVEDGAELRGYDLVAADTRANDLACFTDPATAALLRNASVTPLSYRPIRDLQRAERAA